MSNFCAAHLLTERLSLTSATTRQQFEGQDINYILMPSFNYYNIINVIVCLPNSRNSSVSMNTAM